ncbi:MAG: hypothetical protein A3H44_06170 [Gammaproteobacteria bacterium RIFCSPLOWO2_02_FULL_57_10]|nr:MAG: hypothetical protein A3H44_06170 [Gammaproteobacteria bacterium RIFCSPLOWO2_02_FULL_57_10]
MRAEAYMAPGAASSREGSADSHAAASAALEESVVTAKVIVTVKRVANVRVRRRAVANGMAEAPDENR